jgi:serine/threonine protein kinase
MEDGKVTAPGDVAGTPAYMAPEQTDATGAFGAVGPRSDLYGLGAVLYYIVTRRPPFTGSKAEAVIEEVRKTPVKPPGAVVPGLPPRVEAIILRCLEKRPEARYPDMAALAKDLREEIARARRSLHRENVFLKWKRMLLPR